MDPLPFLQAAPQLLDVIGSKAASLVIGAGASVQSGAPTSATLKAMLRERFPGAEIDDSMNLLDVCTEISNTPPYGRQSLLKFLKEELEVLEPSSEYKQLPRWHWGAIFTTNYDDLLEKAYKTRNRSQVLRPIYLPTSGIITRPDELYLFYLQGSITRAPEDDASPAVSWGDYNRAIQNRAPVMDSFRNLLVAGGQVIYVGYSFDDFLLDGLLEEAGQRVGGRNMPYGYAILPDWPSKEPKRRKITRHNIIPVVGTFEDFTGLIGEVTEHGYQTALDLRRVSGTPATGYSITVHGNEVKFSESEFGVHSEFFEVLEDSLRSDLADLDPPNSEIKQFLQGASKGWEPFRHAWAFRRLITDELVSTVAKSLASPSESDSRIILVHGPAGVGKSILARQLCYDVFTTEGVPTLLAKPGWRVRPDFRLVDRFFDDIEQQLPEGTDSGPALLVIDEAELIDRTLASRLTRYLATRGRELIVVLFARTNEYFRVATGAEPPSKWGYPIEVCVSDTMSDDEIMALVSHIDALGIWTKPHTNTRSFWLKHVAEEHGSCFFDTLYALVEETQQPLRERVIGEYENLGELGRVAYQLVAALHQFGLPLKLEVLSRALNVEWGKFERAIVRGDAQSIIIAEQVTNDANIDFRGRTRQISEIVFTHSLVDHTEELEIFKRIVGAFSPSDVFGVDELDTLRTLLVQVLGPGGFDTRFAPDELAEIFEEATEVVEDDVIEHHFGLLMLNSNRPLEARKHLEKALALSSLLPDDIGGIRESPQNIENSLALAIGDLALEAINRSAPEQADRLFAEASEHFRRARRGSFPNAAAYDAHARLLRKRAEQDAIGDEERIGLFAECLDVLDEGIDNLDAEHRPQLLELKALVLQQLGLQSEAIGELSRRSETGTASERARYHLILARLQLGTNENPKRKLLNRAWSHILDACELDQDYFAAQSARVEIFSKMFRDDIATLHKHVRAALRCPEANESPRIQYELGICSFYLERYSEAQTAFARLRRILRGSMVPPGSLEIAGDRLSEDDPFEFTGTIFRLPTGNWAINSEELHEFGPIWFSHRAERFYTTRQGDVVRFLVGFSKRGASAIELRRT